MSIRIQRACVPAIESRSRASVVESSFWTVPPVDRPNTSAPNEFVPDGGGGGGLAGGGAERTCETSGGTGTHGRTPSGAGLSRKARDPWLCDPASRRVCLCRERTHTARSFSLHDRARPQRPDALLRSACPRRFSDGPWTTIGCPRKAPGPTG